MSVAALLKDLAEHGIAVTLDGANLKLRGGGERPVALLDRVKAAKAEIVAMLGPKATWDAQRWRAYLEERAATFELSAKMPRAQAERLAAVYTRLEWSRQNPPPDPGKGRCAHCGDNVEVRGGRIIRVIDGERDLHRYCEDAFATSRQDAASAALSAVGIRLDQPTGVSVAG